MQPLFGLGDGLVQGLSGSGIRVPTDLGREGGLDCGADTLGWLSSRAVGQPIGSEGDPLPFLDDDRGFPGVCADRSLEFLKLAEQWTDALDGRHTGHSVACGAEGDLPRQLLADAPHPPHEGPPDRGVRVNLGQDIAQTQLGQVRRSRLLLRGRRCVRLARQEDAIARHLRRHAFDTIENHAFLVHQHDVAVPSHDLDDEGCIALGMLQMKMKHSVPLGPFHSSHVAALDVFAQ